MIKNKLGFTLIEILLVIAMLGILAASAFYMGGPYLNRGRDVTRFTDLQEYGRVLDLYFKDNDTLPSNIKADFTEGFCAEEVFFERSNINTLKEGQFEVLARLMGNTPRRDPLKSNPMIAACNRDGSYFYSKVVIGSSQYSILGARMGIASNGNYATGSDISAVTGQAIESNMLLMQNSYKGTIKDTTQGSALYLVATPH